MLGCQGSMRICSPRHRHIFSQLRSTRPTRLFQVRGRLALSAHYSRDRSLDVEPHHCRKWPFPSRTQFAKSEIRLGPLIFAPSSSPAPERPDSRTSPPLWISVFPPVAPSASSCRFYAVLWPKSERGTSGPNRSRWASANARPARRVTRGLWLATDSRIFNGIDLCTLPRCLRPVRTSPAEIPFISVFWSILASGRSTGRDARRCPVGLQRLGGISRHARCAVTIFFRQQKRYVRRVSRSLY